MMTKSIWFPLLTAVGFQCIGLAMTFALPETLPIVTPEQFSQFTNDTPAGAESIPGEQEQGPAHASDQQSETKPWSFFQQADFITRDVAVAALLSTFFVSKLGRQSLNLLVQYVSKRYHWAISKASLCPLSLTPFSLTDCI